MIDSLWFLRESNHATVPPVTADTMAGTMVVITSTVAGTMFSNEFDILQVDLFLIRYSRLLINNSIMIYCKLKIIYYSFSQIVS